MPPENRIFEIASFLYLLRIISFAKPRKRVKSREYDCLSH